MIKPTTYTSAWTSSFLVPWHGEGFTAPVVSEFVRTVHCARGHVKISGDVLVVQSTGKPLIDHSPPEIAIVSLPSTWLR